MTPIDVEGTLQYQLELFKANYSIDIQYPNVSYSPTQGTPYMIVDFLHKEVTPVGVGATSLRRSRGVMQLSIMTTAGDGGGLKKEIIEALRPFFQAGTSITYNSVTARVTNFYLGSYVSSGDWYKSVVNVEFRSDIEK